MLRNQLDDPYAVSVLSVFVWRLTWHDEARVRDPLQALLCELFYMNDEVYLYFSKISIKSVDADILTIYPITYSSARVDQALERRPL